METIHAKISYTKSYKCKKGLFTDKLIKINGFNDLYVKSRLVNKPTLKEVMEQPYIAKVYRLNPDNTITVGRLANGVFIKSIYHDSNW